MSTTKAAYTTAASMTITLNGLANGSARESTAVDNTSNLFLDAHLYVAVTLAAGTPSGGIDVYMYASADGTNFDENVTGSDAAITPRSPSNLVLLGRIQTETAGGLVWKKSFLSIALAFGGVLPRKWGIVIVNNTGLAFAGSGNAVSYSGIHATTV